MESNLTQDEKLLSRSFCSKTSCTQKATETRQRILESALVLFKEKGFAQTSMRDIAERASVAVGASYYYYRTKEELVLAFYEKLIGLDLIILEQLKSQTKSFEERFSKYCTYKVDQLAEYRSFIKVIAKASADGHDPICAFGAGTKPVRDHTIEVMRQLAEGSDLAIAQDLEECKPLLLWGIHLSLIFFWMNDRNDTETRTHKLISLSSFLIPKLFKLSLLPLTGTLRQKTKEMISTIVNEKA
jgi:AcrR family transcriptional regulator